MSKKIGPWQRLDRNVIYDNSWITVHHDEILDPNNHPGIYGSVHFKNYAIGIIPLDPDMHTWIVGQHRYPLNEYSWEIPMGGGSLDQPILESAKRELREETGITAEKWTLFLKLHTSNCVCDETGYAFLAEELSYGEPDFDFTEKLDIRKIHFEEAIKMVMNGDITDSLSVSAIFKLARIRNM